MNRLKELWKQRELTLDDIEAKTGITRGTYSNYENNKTEPKMKIWQKLADFYGESVPYLQGINEPIINNRLKELRKQQGLTQMEASYAIGLHDNTLCQYETGKRNPKPEIWQRLADFYGVSVPYLQGYEQPTPHNRLKELRQERRLSQEDLAKSIGLTRQAISYYENGDRNPSKEIWQQLAVYFGQPVSYIKGEIDTQKIYKIIKAIMLLSQPEIDLTLKAGKMDSDETKKTVLIACFISLIEEINYDPVRAIDEVNSKLHNSGVLDDDTCDRLRTSMDMIRAVTDMALEQYNKL